MHHRTPRALHVLIPRLRDTKFTYQHDKLQIDKEEDREIRQLFRRALKHASASDAEHIRHASTAYRKALRARGAESASRKIHRALKYLAKVVKDDEDI
jgi:hypothetical protein